MSNIPGDLNYSQTHEWAKLEADNVVRVGITDFAQEQLGDVVYIELPEIGRAVHAGKPCSVIESVKAASDIHSPVSGEIVAINEPLKDAPETVNQDSYANWLFCVKASDLAELDGLLNATDYASSLGH
ncbi:MAG: glycine cleavage system protein GcvH [Methylococcaceae bacterium]|nr:glycine cleavage system protein GcvH [Methylococcaceae bacterium]